MVFLSETRGKWKITAYLDLENRENKSFYYYVAFCLDLWTILDVSENQSGIMYNLPRPSQFERAGAPVQGGLLRRKAIFLPEASIFCLDRTVFFIVASVRRNIWCTADSAYF